MAKIKYTKNELKKQKDDLKRFRRYLPTLTLKKQQLQLEIIKAIHAVDEVNEKIKQLRQSAAVWVDLFAEDVKIDNLVHFKEAHITTENIAGIDIPVFVSAEFVQTPYDFMKAPLWVDFGIELIKDLSRLKLEAQVLEEKQRLLAEELRITTQRVNLFEKIKIPKARENIRKINIVLGDMQTAAVVTGKIAKRKIEQKHMAA